MRKVTERQGGTRKNERTYLGGFEIYREYEANGTVVSLERESLHVMDDKQRIALVETRTQGNDGSPAQLMRYQFGNHLGSAFLELDEAGQIISYEEYYPYGSTSYQAGRSASEVSLKRYRYTGMERDEENGLNYHGARYYAPWLGRWTSCDPIGLGGGLNIYSYCFGSCVRLSDPEGTKPWEPEGSAAEFETAIGRHLETAFDFRIWEAQTKEGDSGFPVDPKGMEINVYGSPRTVGQSLSADQLRSARPLQYRDQAGATHNLWVTREVQKYGAHTLLVADLVWSQKGVLLAATDKTGRLTDPSFLASLLNPVDFATGAVVGKAFGGVAAKATGAIANKGSAVVRDVVTDPAVLPRIPPPLWVPRSIRGGGRLWVTKGQVSSDGTRMARFIAQTRRDGRDVTLLTGTHGDTLGRIGVSAEFKLAMGEQIAVSGGAFLRHDIHKVGLNGHAPGIRVLDITRMSETELGLVLSGGGDIYAFWCHSSLTRLLARTFDRVNSVVP
jgi:RHS repeat-associated protein